MEGIKVSTEHGNELDRWQDKGQEHGLYHAQQGFNGFPLAALAEIGEHNCPENSTWINA